MTDRIDLRHLRSFVAVAEERHFGRAATRLGIAQPAVSRHVRALETALGAELLVRTSRRTELTDAGRAALAHAGALLGDADRLTRAVAAAGAGTAGRVTVAFVASTTPGYLAPLVRAVDAELPAIALGTTQVPSAGVGDALRRGDADLAVTRPLLSEPGLVEIELAQEPVVAALPAGHPLAARPDIALGDLDGETHVMVRRSAWPAGYDAALRALRERGVEPAEVREAGSVAAALALVAAGAGVYRLAASAAAPRDGVVYVTVADVRSRVALVRRAEPPEPAVRAVERVAVAVLAPAFGSTHGSGARR
jgi:DNA-binding transcriptional LysR family regulator